MVELKIQHVPTIAYLLSKGAKHNYIPITTSVLGKNIQKSQQAASKHLVELEKSGFIHRILDGRGLSIKITTKGYSEIIKKSKSLQSNLDLHPSDVELKGKLVSGMGEGAYYMSLKGYTRQFKTKIGYIPFPGTLNVQLDQERYLQTISQFDTANGIMIKSFSDGKRTYGWVKCFKATLNKTVQCHIIRLERTHHDPHIVELVSVSNIRKTCKLQDGSKVTIKIPIKDN